MNQNIMLEIDIDHNIREWCKTNLHEPTVIDSDFYFLINGTPKPNNIEHVIIKVKTIEDNMLIDLTWNQCIIMKFND